MSCTLLPLACERVSLYPCSDTADLLRTVSREPGSLIVALEQAPTSVILAPWLSCCYVSASFSS